MNERAEDSSPASAPCRHGCLRHAPPQLPHQRVQGLVLRAPDWWSQPHKLPAPSVGTCVSPPHDRPPRHAECCLQSPSRTRLATRALRRLLSMRVFPLLSLCLSHLPSHHGHCAGLCAHAFTPPDQVGSLLQAMPAPIVTVTQPHGHFVPLRPCWKLEQGICVL